MNNKEKLYMAKVASTESPTQMPPEASFELGDPFNPNPALSEQIASLPADQKPTTLFDSDAARDAAIAQEAATEAADQAAMFAEQADGSNISPNYALEQAIAEHGLDGDLPEGVTEDDIAAIDKGSWLKKILGTSGGKDFLRTDNPAAWGAGAAGLGLGGLALSNAMGNDDEEEEEEEEARRIGLGV
jgi:hypothetical protein